MKTLTILCILLYATTGCDRDYPLIMQNATKGENIEVLYTCDNATDKASMVETEVINGKILNKMVLAPGEVMTVGTVNAKYQPEAEDIKLDYMEVRYRGDTIVFNGKNAIFSSFQKEGSLDWRYIVK